MTGWKPFALILLFLLLSLIIIVLVGQIRLNQTVPDIQRTLLSIQVSQPQSSNVPDAGLLELTQAAAQSTIDTANTLLLVGSAFGTLLTVVLAYVGIAARNDAREANERAKESQTNASSAADKAETTLERLEPLQKEINRTRDDVFAARNEIIIARGEVEQAELEAASAAQEAKATSAKIGNLEDALEAVRNQYQEQAELNEQQIAALSNRLETLSFIFNFAIQLTLPNQLDERMGIQGLIEISRTNDPVILRPCMRLFRNIPQMNFADEDTRNVIFKQLQVRLQEITADETKGEYFRDEARRILKRLDED